MTGRRVMDRPDAKGLGPVVLSGGIVRSHSVIGRWQGPVKHDRMHPVDKNTFWTLTVNDRMLRVQRPVSSVGASGHPDQYPVKGHNSSILWGLLFKPHGQFKLTLLTICIDIATL